MESSEYVIYERDGAVATIRLNRPDRMNSLSRDLVAQLATSWQRFMDEKEARVAIYTGTGKAFCAGRDVKETETGAKEITGPEIADTLFHHGQVTKPVIAAVNGYAVGGGFFDVLHCDLRIAAQSATFLLAEVPRSVLPNPLLEGIAGNLADCLVTEIALGGRVSAARAYEMGLVNRVVPDEELMDAATDMAQSIAALPPLAVTRTLEGLRRLRRPSTIDDEFRAWQLAAIKELHHSEDYREAIAAFLEKRPATFKGR